MKLDGKVALVTGGTKGIGAATAIELARRGANVAIVGRHDDEQAKSVMAAIGKTGRRGLFIQADCGVADNCHRAVRETADSLGRLDLLIHSAGGPVDGKLMEITADDWHAAFNVHVHAVFHLCREALPHLRAAGEAAVVLVSSTAGIRGVVTNIAYQTVKGALPQLTRALARELADDNIRVNCVAPGVIRTAFHANMSEQTRRNNLENRIPLHREGTPDQVASLLVEVATNDYITGQTMVIDGGLTMRIA